MTDDQSPTEPPASAPRPCDNEQSRSERGRERLRERDVYPVIPAGKFAECGDCSGMVLAEFAKSFDKSARRWELIVYPSLFAFIILAMYGFFLIYSLTQDIRTMAASIDPKMGVNMGNLSSNIGMLSNNVELMSTHLEYISDNMETMSVDMQNMSTSVEQMSDAVTTMGTSVAQMDRSTLEMSRNMVSMTKTMEAISGKLNVLGGMSKDMSAMSQAVHVMAGAVNIMSYDMNGATRPMSFMNRFMPW
ncbi:MAG: methyl-accepting chemotaxis protein [Magnetococcales bacterium]|nr:methyl-accepting chemotaxis protein [Magnetococcales bacterium]